VAPGDPEELAAALRGLHDSPARRQTLAQQGGRRVGERFAWPAVAVATAGLYRAAINEELGC
jgi:glycosyltransferase involved in cell wall biosynthesis